MPTTSGNPQARTITWICVRESLPDDDTTVLCCCETEVFMGYHSAGQWIDCTSDEPITVTHWSALPEPATS